MHFLSHKTCMFTKLGPLLCSATGHQQLHRVPLWLGTYVYDLLIYYFHMFDHLFFIKLLNKEPLCYEGEMSETQEPFEVSLKDCGI